MDGHSHEFHQLHDAFYFISDNIPKDTIAITYYEDEATFSSFKYKELRKQCEQVNSVLNRNQISSTIGILCDSGLSAIVCMFGSLVNNSFIFLSSGLKNPELMNLMVQAPVSAILVDNICYTKFSSPLKEFVIAEEFCIFQQKFFILKLGNNLGFEDKIFKNGSLAYVICTSGSTGSPKLVYVPHECILPNIKDFKKLFSISSYDTILNLSPLTFDPSIVDIFLSLSYGAHLILLAPNLVKRSKVLETILQSNKVSFMQITPSLMGFLQPDFLRKYFLYSSPRIIAFGGEVFPSPLQCSQWFPLNCTVRVFNLYGLTELSCWASYYEVNIKEYILNFEVNKVSTVPLGFPLTGTILHLVDDLGYKVTKGMTGYIKIGGERNICYITEEGKLQNFNKDIITGDVGYTDGTHIYYVERVFNSVKRNGCKIGLNEIESTLKSLLGIMQCCALLYKEQICLFVTLSQTMPLKEKILWAHLEKHLSSWKMPNKIYIIEEFPINHNGKIDKEGLLEMVIISKRNCIMKNLVDQSVCETMSILWKEHLENCLPNQDDNFINLGGNSLKAIELVEEIQQFYRVSNSQILETLLNYSFRDICKLVMESQKNSHQENSDIKPSAKRKFNALEADQKVPGGFKYLNFTDRRGYHFNGTRVLSMCSNIKKIQLIWKGTFNKCIDASPLLIESHKQIRVFIGSHSHKMACFDENGIKLWVTELPDRIESSASMSFDSQAVYVGSYDGNLYSLDVIKGIIMWKFKTDGLVKCSPAVHFKTGCIIFGSYDKYLYCCSHDGKLHWKRKVSNGSLYSSPAIHNNFVYAATLDGYLVCLDLNGNLEWKKLIGSPIFSSLGIFCDGIIIGCTDNFVYCIDYSSKILWKYKTGGPIFSSPFIFENGSDIFIAIGSHDHSLYLFNNSGRLVTCVTLSSPIFSTPFVIRNKEKQIYYILFCETVGNVHIAEIQLSKNINSHLRLLDNYRVGGEIFSSPIFHNGKVYVGCRDNYLYCLSFVG